MSIFLHYADLRITPSKLLKGETIWYQGMTAYNVVEQILGIATAEKVEDDLQNNNVELKVSWYNTETQDICDIGGVRTLAWDIDNNVFLTINYENDATTQVQIDEAIAWSEENGPTV